MECPSLSAIDILDAAMEGVSGDVATRRRGSVSGLSADHVALGRRLLNSCEERSRRNRMHMNISGHGGDGKRSATSEERNRSAQIIEPWTVVTWKPS
jgi:hypothetical protein